METLDSLGHFIMTPLYYAISAVMLAFHWLFTQLGLDAAGGLPGPCRSSA